MALAELHPKFLQVHQDGKLETITRWDVVAALLAVLGPILVWAASQNSPSGRSAMKSKSWSGESKAVFCHLVFPSLLLTQQPPRPIRPPRQDHQRDDINLDDKNEEFASFVHQLARNFQKSVSGSVNVALGPSFVQVKVPFGGSGDFPVNSKDIYPDWEARDETVSVSYTMMILACL